MVLRKTLFVILTFTVGLFSSSVMSQDQTVHIKLSDEDQFVIRSIVLSTKSGGDMANILAVEAFDPQRAEFTFTRAAAGKLTIAATDISSFTISRLPRKQRPMEQSAPWHIDVTPREIRSIEVPIQSIRFDSGQLVVSDPRAVPPNDEFTTEANRIEYVSENKKFIVTIQFMKYARIFEGGSGDPTGRGKGMM